MNSKNLSVKEQYAMAYKSYKECVECCDNKYEWAASEVFGLATYDGELDRMFVERICDVCKYIAAGKTYEFINMSEENYITYILVCQVLYKKNWINWGTSIRGAFFDGYYSNNPILEWSCSCPYDVLDISVPFNMKNIMELVAFIEEEDHNLAELARLQGIDCNACKHISLTEARQRREGSSIMPHICEHYKEICRHNSNDPNARYIYPCDKCLQDNHRYFEVNQLCLY